VTRADYAAWARWVFDTCIAFGAEPEIAAEVAAAFVGGVRREREGEPHA
jgi:hypothetical protein